MNRQMKRAQRRQGTTLDRARATAPARRNQAVADRKRTGIRQFLKEVRQELKKVLWPTRRELVTYTIVVLVTVVVLTTYVFGLDVVFSKFVLDVFA
ncbi:MAG: preprotein translocase subunit SecE [Actinobacteria bacterium RBG_19FT_COMBO_70_19]|jgi:preprotein translocase subunit SecE|nr:MAG: preprotein translocase subunit SecE [Actinobacteria bacterium RBG_19FT_COMBO_70_19]